jgi:hypothetical protein
VQKCGLCIAHGPPRKRCSVVDCGRIARKKGLCRAHTKPN